MDTKTDVRYPSTLSAYKASASVCGPAMRTYSDVIQHVIIALLDVICDTRRLTNVNAVKFH